VAFAADGQVLASASVDGTIKLWDVRSGQEADLRFRRWATAADLHLHRQQAEAADKAKQPLAVAFHLGRYLAAQQAAAAAPQQAATLAGWLATASHPPGLLPGLPFAVPTPLHEQRFPDGVACAGVLCKDSGIDPARLLIGTTRALEGDPNSWLNLALHGGALYRSGAYVKAQAALTRAAELRGKPCPLTDCLLALTHLKLKQAEKAKKLLEQARLRDDAPWEDAYVDRLFAQEVNATFGIAERRDAEK
jgi:tetratricopeptide (TPR) repeat protein